jgi:hypothetical protein
MFSLVGYLGLRNIFRGSSVVEKVWKHCCIQTYCTDISMFFSVRRRQLISSYCEGVSKIFGTDAVKFINLTTKRLLKLPTSTQLRATWHTDSLYLVVLPSTGASRYHNCCIDGGISPKYFGYALVYALVLIHGEPKRRVTLIDMS